MQAVTALAARKPASKKSAKPAASREGSKTTIIVNLISRAKGATLTELLEAAAWQKHSVRGFLYTLNKKGTPVTSFKNDAGERTYRTGTK